MIVSFLIDEFSFDIYTQITLNFFGGDWRDAASEWDDWPDDPVVIHHEKTCFWKLLLHNKNHPDSSLKMLKVNVVDTETVKGSSRAGNQILYRSMPKK